VRNDKARFTRASALKTVRVRERIIPVIPSRRKRSAASDMSSVWKRLQRVNKRAAKFQFTVSYHEVTLETTTKWWVTPIRSWPSESFLSPRSSETCLSIRSSDPNVFFHLYESLCNCRLLLKIQKQLCLRRKELCLRIFSLF